jgi:FixJ family two-component response regulator
VPFEERGINVIDLGLPGVPGDQVAKEVRRLDPEVATVLVTGWALGADDPRLALFDFHLEKPFADLRGVEAVVARAIELHGQRRR